jgi:hypothetical protein
MSNDPIPHLSKPLAWFMIAGGVLCTYFGLLLVFKHNQPATRSALLLAGAFLQLGQGLAALTAASHPRFSNHTLLAARLAVIPVMGLGIWTMLHPGAMHP